MTVTINGTTGVAVPLGSVSAPGVSNTTSSTTGIYNPTSTSLAIATNGVNALTIDATQNATFAGAVTGLIESKIQPITASVASNALTITLNPTVLDFRSTTLGSGTVTAVTISSAISVVVPASATLGTVNATAARLVVLAINNAGTAELAVVNISGGNQLDETNLITTTAISAAATSASTIYSTSARTSVAYRVVGFLDITEATAGTWATAPSTIQGVGGQALAAMSSIGYGQTWQSVTRSSGTTYYNTTGKPIQVQSICTVGVGSGVTQATIGGVSLGTIGGGYNQSGTQAFANATLIVPPGMSYVLTDLGGAFSSRTTNELR